MKPSLERVRELLAYDPETGVFTRKVANSNSTKVGDVAGALTDRGYVRMRVDGCFVYGQGLAWFYVHGVWPEQEIDHINGVRSDNRIGNLRDVSRKDNMQNQRKAQASNKSTGVLGVHFHKAMKKFRASIRFDGKPKHLGYFTTADDAHSAYVAAKRQLHEGCTL